MQKLEDGANPGRDTRSAMNVSDANDSKREGQASNFAIGGALAVGLTALVIAVVALEKESPSQEQCAFGGITNDAIYYTSQAPAFVGLNPRNGNGGGFINRDFTEEEFGLMPGTNGQEGEIGVTRRTNMCTCDCQPSPDGVGCSGYGGIAFRYMSLLASPGKDGSQCSAPWSGQMVALDCGAGLGGRCNTTNPNQAYFQFTGEDIRESPGGAAIYSVAIPMALADGGNVGIFGTFRQSNLPISCAAGIADLDYEDTAQGRAASCAFKCPATSDYFRWIDYCQAATEDTSLGFSGYSN